jgi:hypothetical protein
VRLMLKVEADDTEDIMATESEAERTLQERIQILESHFNIKVIDQSKNAYLSIIHIQH